jgi:ASC-1-like (ASCH) protein
MRLHASPFERIKSGSKHLEARLNDAKRKQIKVGDTVVFLKRPDCVEKMTVRVTERHENRSFKSLFEKLEYQSKSNMRDYYSAEDEAKYGVVGFRFEVIDGGV